MLNLLRLGNILSQYKQGFVLERWGKEKYKWGAVKCFQDNWDINAPDFAEMLGRALSKTYNLLTSANNFPKNMIIGFARSAPEEVRTMFLSLYDENEDIYKRMSDFKTQSATLLKEYGNGAAQHYQYENAISIYLWLRFPDKYYIYKFGEVKMVASELEADYRFKKGDYAGNIHNFLKLYDEICAELKADTELVNLLQSHLTEDCYPDPELRTLTVDVGFYISRYFSQKDADSQAEEKWFPDDYTPGFSVDEWVKLLKDPAIFTHRALEIMKRMKDCGGQATCKQLSVKYGQSSNFYNAGSSALAKRIANKTDCPLLSKNVENSKWWPILYVGQYASGGDQGSYIWKLRDELSKALDRVDLSKVELYAADSPIKTYTRNDFLNEVYMTKERYDSLVTVLRNKKNIILQGAPGVGKTFAARRLAWSMMGEADDGRVQLVQFHQNYSYEDFVMGYKPTADGFELKHGTFYRFCQKAASQPDEEFFFIIDEINRGNMSKIFGELLMLIEKDYRTTELTLAYDGLPFSVPKNLYIIGMMNTADRSLAMIDYALRRRFSFFEMEPGFDTEGFMRYQNSLNNVLLNELIDKIKDLNCEIASDRSLGKGFCIGHSYFCGRETCTKEWLRSVVDYDILPMLGEYWFDDASKLQRWEKILHDVFR